MKSTGDLAVKRVVVATGISSVVTQLLVIRECLAQFRGNEFVIALILFNWLILGGLGTLLARRPGGRRWRFRATPARLGWLSLLLSAMPVLQILAIRLLRDIVFISGASAGFYQTLAYTFSVMAPYGLLVGFVLPYSLFVLRREDPGYPGARVYIADNIGDVAGGALFAFVLVTTAKPFQGILLSGLPLLFCAWFLFPKDRRFCFGPMAGAALCLIVLVSGIFLETASLKPVQGELAYYAESRFGRITVHRDREQHTVFSDGVPISTSFDPVAAEEAVHYPLAQVEQPEKVLLISAQSGMFAELAKYRLKTVDYVELNPEVTRVQFDFRLIRHIPGLRVVHRDGRAFLNGADTRYDAILVNLPEPETFQINRFFTDGFFDLARRRLTPGGVLCFSVQGFDNYLAEPQRQKISSLYHTARAFFDHVMMLPGQKIFFLCSGRPMTAGIPGRLGEKGIETRYIGRYYDGDLTGERIRQLNGLVDPATPANTDLSPRLMRIMFTQWFAKFSATPVPFFAVAGILALFCLLRSNRETFVLFTTGFMTMGSEILVIFAFQIFFGYIYTQIGLIVTVFLAGLMPGAWTGHRIRRRRRGTLMVSDLLLMLLAGIFIAVVAARGDFLSGGFFLAFGFAVSFVCGCQFPLVLGLRGDDDTAAIGAFSADLMGAAFGTLVTSTVLLPYTGITGAAVGLIILKLASLIVVGTGHEKVQQT